MVDRLILCCTSFNSEDRVHTIVADTLILSGKGDRVVPFENAELLREKIPSSQVVMIERTGHLFFMEQPEITNKLIIEFLKQCKPNGGIL